MRALLLDALGTLLRLEPPAPMLRAELARRFGVEISEAQAAQAIAAEISYYRLHLDEGSNAATLADVRARCAEELRAALPQSDSIAAIENAALQAALLASLRFSVYADVTPALRAARSRGERVIVVSNWDVSLHGVLEGLGLRGRLDGILTSAEAASRKPAPEIFWRALELAGCRAADALHVGDSLEEDVEGAQAAGIEPVLIVRDGPAAHPAVRTIGSLLELGS